MAQVSTSSLSHSQQLKAKLRVGVPSVVATVVEGGIAVVVVGTAVVDDVIGDD